jgi:hypothetical protein
MRVRPRSVAYQGVARPRSLARAPVRELTGAGVIHSLGSGRERAQAPCWPRRAPYPTEGRIGASRPPQASRPPFPVIHPDGTGLLGAPDYWPRLWCGPALSRPPAPVLPSRASSSGVVLGHSGGRLRPAALVKSSSRGAPHIGTSATRLEPPRSRVLGHAGLGRATRRAVDRSRSRSGRQRRDLRRVETSAECCDLVRVWRAGARQDLGEFSEVALVTGWRADE